MKFDQIIFHLWQNQSKSVKPFKTYEFFEKKLP